jgi:hypothetical protein
VKIFWGSLNGREKALLIWAVVSTLVALVAMAGWVWRLQPMATVWGDVGTWFAGAVTLGGLVYAGRSLRLQTEQRRAEDEYRRGEEERRLTLDQRKEADEFRIQRSAALAVSLGSRAHRVANGRGYKNTVASRLVNGGPNPIHHVLIGISRGSEKPEENKKEIVPARENFSAAVQWFSDERFEFANPDLTAYAYFTDDWGNRWKRTRNQLQSVPLDSTLPVPETTEN